MTHLPAYALNELTEVGVRQEALPVRKDRRALSAFQPSGTPHNCRPLWWRALSKRGSLR
jgi:hypothetical protein